MSTAALQAQYFDGRSGRRQIVRLVRDGDRLRADLIVTPSPETDAEPGAATSPPAGSETGTEAFDERAASTQPGPSWPLADVQWPERTRHGQRVLHLRGGGLLKATDAAAFDSWRAAIGPADSGVVRLQQHWPATVLALVTLAALLVAGYLWAVPRAAQWVLQAVPAEVDQRIGDVAWRSLQPRLLEASSLPEKRQAQVRAAFAQAVRAAYPDTTAPAYEIRFAVAPKALGPNAFALPGGTIVVTDALVDLLHDQDDALMGVLAHELGHLRHRHGIQAVVQVALLNMGSSAVFGDFSSMLASVPALLGQLSYSRDAERQADAEAVRVLRAAGLSPAAMVVFFDRLAQQEPATQQQPLPLATHPADDERRRYFEAAAQAH